MTIHITEEQKIDAVHRLAINKNTHADLREAEAQARVTLGAAIIELDKIEERINLGEPMHSLYEQMLVEQAKDEYTQALANLLRGEAPPAEGAGDATAPLFEHEDDLR